MTQNQLKAKILTLVTIRSEMTRMANGLKTSFWADKGFDELTMLFNQTLAEVYVQVDEMYAGADDNEDFIAANLIPANTICPDCGDSIKDYQARIETPFGVAHKSCVDNLNKHDKPDTWDSGYGTDHYDGSPVCSLCGMSHRAGFDAHKEDVREPMPMPKTYDPSHDENLCQHCEENLDNASAAAIIWHHYKGCVDSKVDAEFEEAAYYDTSRD